MQGPTYPPANMPGWCIAGSTGIMPVVTCAPSVAMICPMGEQQTDKAFSPTYFVCRIYFCYEIIAVLRF